MEERTPNEPVAEGGCACGAVRYRLRGVPIFVNNCHCRLCQRQSGAASVVNAFYESDRVERLSGDLAETRVATGSGGQQVVLRCSACGTVVWSHYPGLGRRACAVRAGTLDVPEAMRPDAATYVAERWPWVALPQDIPAFSEYYRPSELLPPERFARLKAVIAEKAQEV